ncbi:MAG: TIGR03668 family PPOX class F420-dependent oxidoreductase [Thermoplasmata archaeon]
MRWTGSDRTFIGAQRVAHMATADAGGEPHVIPVCFVFDGENFYTAVDQKRKRVPPDQLRRIRNLRENAQVALLLDEYQEDWSRLRYLLVRGKASLVEAEGERRRAFHRLEEKYAQYREVDLQNSLGPLIRIDPESVHRWHALEKPEEP